ncbi:hypothetical protein L3X38_018089 [Prunus dulcis]|uniref:Uncharacterized protein n=1 Tax=Prunus dulcis TaxID=3755 RepID=A0AAD4WAC2_PRUDU|nr:hypothetical protein L3X38_018089 [Prunus dulcis]
MAMLVSLFGCDGCWDAYGNQMNGFERAWLRKEKLKTLKGMGEKVEDIVVMAEEWLGWPLECLQQLNGGRKVVWWLLKGVDGCWDACSS